MGKKRVKDKAPREDEVIDLTGPSCTHIRKGIDNSFLKKSAANSNWNICQDCTDKEDTAEILPEEDQEETESPVIWLCLKCGHRGCGRYSEQQHSVKHYETPRSDPHCLVVSMDNWSVWCYLCDDDVQYSATGHLAQLVTNLKKQTSQPRKITPPRKAKVEESLPDEERAAESVKTEDDEGKENKENQKKSVKKAGAVTVKSQKPAGKTEDGSVVTVKGLSNLGNTCFFNAVIQNLSQTQLFRQTLGMIKEEKTSLNITPGASSSDLEPILVQLDQPGSLTVAMCHLLNEIQESKTKVVTPRDLFSQVCKKAARFKGFQQQDSQELLRYLLDGMRAEEIKRVNSGILEALKKSGKNTDGEQAKTLLKEYEKNGAPKNFVDHVFGGEMTSTVMCQQCKTVSLVTEMFLDLSLPVSDEAHRKKSQKGAQKPSAPSQPGRDSPVLTNGTDDMPTGAGSKYQQKKAKKQAKKQAKNQRRQYKQDGTVTLDSLTSQSPTESPPMDPTDPEDGEKADDGTCEEAPVSPRTPEERQEKPDRDRANGEREEEKEEDSAMDVLAVGNHFTVLSEDHTSKDGATEDGKTSEVEQGAEEEEDEEEEEGEEEEEEGEGEVRLAGELEDMSLNDGFCEDPDAAEQNADDRDASEEEEEEAAKEYIVVNQDPELAFQTLATRTTSEKQECSVQSCLLQFTEVEKLTENNSLLCVTCTKRWPQTNNSAGPRKNVYTDALKQMLISSPPPVLTLHLKRFQQTGYRCDKVNRHVQFPQILDLAPFCAVHCKNLPEGNKQVFYSLYGIVEHSGTMRSGHYTAYVKARPRCPTSNGVTTQGDGEAPRGSWFHVSDSSVQPASESKAQASQAYLLFYERIP